MVNSTPTTVSQGAAQSTGSPFALFVGVAVSFLSAILVYTARQYWEKRKLHKALLTEVEAMEGIKICADQMERIGSPPSRQLTPDDVPTGDSIPTTIYESTSSKIGLLGGIRTRKELQGAVKFYSKILRYKSIINQIENQGQDSDESSVSDTDQEDLYEKIGKIDTVRKRIIRSKSFDVEYPEEIE